MNIKRVLIATSIIIILILIVILSPITSRRWGSATGTTKDCSCFGKEQTESWIGGATTTCDGILYNCK